MTDPQTLVTRLRAVHQEITESDGGECDLMAMVREAADRIEALEKALHCISLGSQNSGTTKEGLGAEARRALKEK